jgi:anti-sigma B factor antagonist
VEIDVSSLGDRLVCVRLSGRLDTQGVGRVESRFVASLVPGGNSAIVDLSRVDFVSSMGVRMLISAARTLKSRQASLAVFGASAPVNQVLEATALNRILPICTTENEALAAVGSARRPSGA